MLHSSENCVQDNYCDNNDRALCIAGKHGNDSGSNQDNDEKICEL